MKRSYWIVGAALAVVALTIVLVIGVRDGARTERPPLAQEVSAPTRGGSSGQPLATSAAADTPPTVKPTIDVDLRHAFSTSRNYREFIARAKAEVDRGGAVYAIYAVGECDRVRIAERQAKSNPIPQKSDDSRDIVPRAEAKTLLDARCGPLMDQEVDTGANLKAMRANGDLQRDPLGRIWLANFDPAFRTDPAARRRYVTAVLEAQDPLLWERSLGVMVRTDPATGKAYFDGTSYDAAKEPALRAAQSLVACGLGFSCDAGNDTQVAVVCLYGMWCEHDRFELAKREAGLHGYAFDRVMMFYDRMVAAFKDKRVEAFVPPT